MKLDFSEMIANLMESLNKYANNNNNLELINRSQYLSPEFILNTISNTINKYYFILETIKYDDLLQQVIIIIEKYAKIFVNNIPYIENLCIEIFEIMFAPKQVIRQIAMISLLQILLLIYSSLSLIWKKLLLLLTNSGRKLSHLKDKLKLLNSYDEWKVVAGEIDKIQGHDVWRNEDTSTLYDSKMLQKRIIMTRDMLQRGDVFDLMFRLRGGLARYQYIYIYMHIYEFHDYYIDYLWNVCKSSHM